MPAPQETQPKRRKHVVWFQLCFSLLLVIALAYLVDWRDVAGLVLSARPGWIAAAAVFVVATRMLIALRWGYFLFHLGHKQSWRDLMHVVSAGMGLGSLLPSSFGPDIARGVLLKTHTAAGKDASATSVVSSLLVDRFTAAVGTVVVAIVGAVCLSYWAIAFAFIVGLAAVGLLLGVAFSPGRGRRSRVFSALPKTLRHKLGNLAAAVRAPVFLRKIFPVAVLISTGVILCRVGAFVCLYHSFGVAVPLLLALLTIPLLQIALMAPVTVGGFGVREWILVVGFETVGVPADVSVSVGLLAFALQIAVSFPAVAHLTRKRVLSALQ